MTNPHQVDDEKLFQGLFLFFNLYLFGFRPRQMRSKELFLDKILQASNRYHTSCNTDVEQRNVERVELP